MIKFILYFLLVFIITPHVIFWGHMLTAKVHKLFTEYVWTPLRELDRNFKFAYLASFGVSSIIAVFIILVEEGASKKVIGTCALGLIIFIVIVWLIVHRKNIVASISSCIRRIKLKRSGKKR